MKWKRTAMSLALAGCMMATTVPVTAFAAETTMATQYATDASDNLTALDISKSEAVLSNSGDTTNDTTSVDIEVAASSGLATTGDIVATSDNNKIVTIGQGVATANGGTKFTITAAKDKTGTANITFTATKADKTTVTATCKITVIEPKYIDTVSIVDISMKKGDADIDLSKKEVIAPADATQTVGTITWESDESVAKVVSDKLQAVGRGTTTVYGYYTVGKDRATTKMLQFNVSVTDPTASVTIDYKNAADANKTIYVGDTRELTAKVGTKDEAVTWSSTDESKATVKDGVLTAVGTGRVTIVATAADGTKGSKSFTIAKKGEAATGVAFDKTTLTMMQGQGLKDKDDETTLAVVTTPAEADVDVTVSNLKVNGNTSNSYVTLTQKGSDNEWVVKVADNAPVGTYRIAATASYQNAGEDATTKDIECLLTVTNADISRAQGIEFTTQADTTVSNTTASLTTNTTTPIEGANTGLVKVVEVTPNTDAMKKLVSYSIDNTSVAKVIGNADDGYQVVALKEGYAVLTATLGDKSASIDITVTDATADANKITAIRMSDTVAALVAGSDVTKTLSVEAQTAASKAWVALSNVNTNAYAVVWSSSDEKVATVKDGVVTPKAAGTATITATVGNFTATCKVTVVDENTTPSTGFVDVPADAWYADAVNTAAAKGLMNGTGNNKFEPLKTVQRSQVAAIVWNIEGAPAVTGTTPFTDVAADAWYAQAVTWAYQNKVVSGTSATTFAPNQNITRQDFAVVLYNKAGKPAASADLSKFVDASKINSWAQDAVKWAVSKGIINGNDKNELNPTGTLTRAEAASIIVKYVG